MKKLFALFITFLYLTVNSCFAFSELYYLENTTVDTIKPYVTSSYAKYDYNLTKQNPYYGRYMYNNSDYAVVILQQSGNNMFYYYQSNDSNKINKYILKQVKKAGIVSEQSQNANIISIYDKLAQETISPNTQRQYVFDDNNSSVQTMGNQTSTYSSNTLKGSVVHVPSGTQINAYLQNAVNTSTAQKGDQVVAVLTADVLYNGVVIFPQGSRVYGTVTQARHASYGSRNGKVVITFTQLVTPENKSYDVTIDDVDFSVTNEGKFASVAGSTLGGAAIGALAGLLIGAMSSSSLGGAVALGAGIGAGGGLLNSTAGEKGVDAEIPSFTELELILKKSVTVTVSY